jgi:hypothetical protein
MPNPSEDNIIKIQAPFILGYIFIIFEFIYILNITILGLMHNKIIEKLDITNLSAVLVQEKDCIFK